MVYNYKKQRNPIVPMYTILGTSDDTLEKKGENETAAMQQIRKIEDTPAANSYSLPFMIGKTVQSSKWQAPCYSMTGRSKVGSYHEDMAKTPGPATYNTTDPNVFRVKAPHYSMASNVQPWYSTFTAWNVMPDYNTKKPGPGAHSPENVWINKRAAPKFSFGTRHHQNPAPIIVDAQD